jgi:cysteinyl-tRNA synthetase
LFEEGMYVHDKMYVLLRGKMAASYSGNGTRVRELVPGCVIGGLSFFTDAAQQETVRYACLSNEYRTLYR